jgi:hypothetical protein
MLPNLLASGAVRGRAIIAGGGNTDSDSGFVEPPTVTLTASGDTTISGKVKPGSFGKFVYPFAVVAANTSYVIKYTPNFTRMSQGGKLALVGFGFKNSNDFHIVGLRGDGSTGLKDYQVYGTPPNGWNKDTGHTTVQGSAPTNGTQAGPNWIRLDTSSDGTTYTFYSSSDGATWTAELTGQAPTPFSNVSSVTTFGVALWFNNADTGPFDITIQAGTSPSFAVTVVKNASNQTAVNYSVATKLTWDTNVFDDQGCHSTTANTSRITIPLSLTGKYVTLSACVELSNVTAASDLYMQIYKNGSTSYNGWGGHDATTCSKAYNVANKAWIQCFTQPILVSAGDYFEVELYCSDTSVDVTAAKSSFSLHMMAGTLDGALVKLSADSGNTFFNFDILAWDAEVYDTAAYHDNVTNNSRLTIPVGANGKVGLVKFSADFAYSGGLKDDSALIRKNAATDSAQPTKLNQATLTDAFTQAISKPITLATADFFTVLQHITAIRKSARQTFGIQIFSSFTGAVVKKSADQTSANYSTPAVIAWNTEDIDTNTIHDTVTNNSRLTVPPALNGKWAIISASVTMGGSTFTANSDVSLNISKNGGQSYDGFGGQSRQLGSSYSHASIQAYTQPVLLVTGDYYEAELYSGDTSVTVNSTESWLTINVLN